MRKFCFVTCICKHKAIFQKRCFKNSHIQYSVRENGLAPTRSGLASVPNRQRSSIPVASSVGCILRQLRRVRVCRPASPPLTCNQVIIVHPEGHDPSECRISRDFRAGRYLAVLCAPLSGRHRRKRFLSISKHLSLVGWGAELAFFVGRTTGPQARKIRFRTRKFHSGSAE